MAKSTSLSTFSLGRGLRRTTEDEAILWDHKCPKCETGSLIGKWSWRDRKYTEFRCSEIDCPHGNLVKVITPADLPKEDLDRAIDLITS